MREVISQARASGQVPEGTRLAPSPVHRLLRRAGLTGRPREPGPGPARPFAYAEAGELWMADVMHGPKAGCDPGDRRRRAKTYLIALLDDATRVVPHAAFAFTENAEAFLAVLRQAILRRGRPLRLYVDNGSAFRSKRLQVVCAQLGINLIHARPYRPQGKAAVS